MLSRAVPALVQTAIYAALLIVIATHLPDATMASATTAAAADGAPIASHPSATVNLLHLLGVLGPLTLVVGGLAIALESRLAPRDNGDA